MLLDVQDLRVEFRVEAGWLRAVDGVSFSLDAGRTLGVVGESGSGKSVSALTLLRLLPEPPARIVSGRVIFEGTDLLALPKDELRKVRGGGIGFIFQDPMTFLNPVMTAGEQVAEAVREHVAGVTREAAKERALAMLDAVGIPEPRARYDAYPHQLSGGLRQRVVIAMALAAHPRLLVADEPTTALDVTVQAQILELIAKLRRELKMSVLLITHDLGIVRGAVDDVIVMYAGEVVEAAPAADLFASPMHPYTRALLASVPSIAEGIGSRARLPGIEGTVPSPLDLPKGCRFQGRCPLVKPHCREKEPELETKKGRRVRCFEV